MKHFDTSTQSADIMQTNGAFFAFSQEQFESQKKSGIVYAALGSGLVCPKENIDALMEAMEVLEEEKIEWELANNTAKEIMWDAFSNYESQITGCIEDAVESLEGYGFTEKQIEKEYQAYFQHCVENDLF